MSNEICNSFGRWSPESGILDLTSAFTLVEMDLAIFLQTQSLHKVSQQKTMSLSATATPIQRPLFQDNLDKPVQKGKNSLDLNEASDDIDVVWDAVASAEPYANSLHLAPDR